MKVLAIAPHPDDETLGCGGTLLRHKAAGDQINWLIVTRLDESQAAAEVRERKDAEIEKVANAYGFEQVVRLKLSTTNMDVMPLGDLIRKFSDAIEQVRPDCVYLNHAHDVHSDHRVVFSAVMSVLKPFYS